MAEFALYRYLEKNNIIVDKPDLDEYGLGKWDLFDLECQGKHFSVKSTKAYGELLLLETKDWNEDGRYIPNIRTSNDIYDYTVLVRFSPDGEALMKQYDLLYQKEEDISYDKIRKSLIEVIYQKNWIYDFPGFIYHSELVDAIKERRIIPKNAMLNGKRKMDAENYYFQTGNLHPMLELYTPNIEHEIDERADLRLKRTCPKCGKMLVLKYGYSWFWGCEEYHDKIQCRYKEKLKNK